jgi:hypothetical protein
VLVCRPEPRTAPSVVLREESDVLESSESLDLLEELSLFELGELVWLGEAVVGDGDASEGEESAAVVVAEVVGVSGESVELVPTATGVLSAVLSGVLSGEVVGASAGAESGVEGDGSAVVEGVSAVEGDGDGAGVEGAGTSEDG